MAPATPSKTTYTKSLSNAGNILSGAYGSVYGPFDTLDANVNLEFHAVEDCMRCPAHFLADYESLSNNGSCSGESEDQKDKIASTNAFPISSPNASPNANHPQARPGCETDKQDKIRLKNERKHQRQKEKRMKELHDRCASLLMSRKLEIRSQQLVAMGFPAEESLVSLMLNDGGVENSVTWLIDRGIEMENVHQDPISGLKIDISNELAEIAGMRMKFNCTAQDVERIVVSCEGDLEKTAETLMSNHQEPADCDPPISIANQVSPSMVRPITKLHAESKLASQINIQQPMTGVQMESNYYSTISRNEILAPKSRTIGPCFPSSTLSTDISIQIQEEALRKAGAVTHHHPKSMNAIQMIESNLDELSPANAEWNPIELSDIGMVKERRLCQSNQNTFMSSSEDLGTNGCAVGSSHGAKGTISRRVYSVIPSSSLGLFSGWRSSGSSGLSLPLDWSMGDLMPLCDYNTIDWSIESTPLNFDAVQSKTNDGLYETRSATAPIIVNNDLGALGLQGGSVRAKRTRSSYPIEGYFY